MRLFTLAGIPVRIDLSWLVIAALVTGSLATGYFPPRVEGLGAGGYLLLGLLGALGLFGSIILHELAHALVAIKNGIKMRGITLFIFGGVAEMEAEPSSAKVEFLVAAAGPAASILISGVCHGLEALGHWAGWPAGLVAVFAYLGFINLLLVAFNMVPAFPLDGGRVLRALLWHKSKNVVWATRITSNLGLGFGVLLIGLGFLLFLQGDIIGGIWLFMVGMFVRHAAGASWRHVALRQALAGRQVRRYMTVNPLVVAPTLPVGELVDEVFMAHTHKMYPVVHSGALLGCVTLAAVQALPRGRWGASVVADIMEPVGPGNTVAAAADALAAAAAMGRAGRSRMMVVEGGELAGVVSIGDLLRVLTMQEALRIPRQGRG